MSFPQEEKKSQLDNEWDGSVLWAVEDIHVPPAASLSRCDTRVFFCFAPPNERSGVCFSFVLTHTT
jgi:hypothetical protein